MLNLMSEMHLHHFKQRYDSSREQFLESLDTVTQELLVDKQSYVHPELGPSGELLYCDMAFISLNPTPANVLVLISGTHGVEGFTGSAVQSDCLPLLIDVLLERPDLGVLLIHALNPWGFAWLRRCDHEGIDLNRNFIDFDHALPMNPGYAALYEKLQSLAMDEQESGFSRLRQDIDFQNFIEEITKGQYEDSSGLFYGGNHPSWSRKVLERISEKPFVKTALRISVVDVHTGLGPYGYGEVINDHEPETEGFEWAKRLYGSNAYSALMGESCSPPKLGLLDYHWHSVIGDRGCFITLEFGTYSVERLIGELIVEQHYHHALENEENRDIKAKPVQTMKDFFYPFEERWQQQVLFRSRQVVDMALSGMVS